jgi:hypothetical protein
MWAGAIPNEQTQILTRIYRPLHFRLTQDFSHVLHGIRRVVNMPDRASIFAWDFGSKV